MHDAHNQPSRQQDSAILTFRLAGYTYALFIADVIQIIEMATIIHLPQSPASVRGVINFHGTAVPIIDLRTHFSLPYLPYGAHTPIILVNFTDRPLGLVVDSVEEVFDISDWTIIDPKTVLTPELVDLEEPSWRDLYLAGLVEIADRIVPILQTDALLTPGQQAQVNEGIPNELLPEAQKSP